MTPFILEVGRGEVIINALGDGRTSLYLGVNGAGFSLLLDREDALQVANALRAMYVPRGQVEPVIGV